MLGQSKDLTVQEIQLAQEVFSLGVEMGKFGHIVGVDTVNYQKYLILQAVRSDVPLSLLLGDLYERGKSVGERRRINLEMQNT